MNENSNEKAMAFRIAQYIKEHLYPPECFAELRQLKTPTDKAVYQHIMFRGPSRYSHIRKALDLGHHGLSDSLKRMQKTGFIYITEANQYELTARKEILKTLKNAVFKALYIREGLEKFLNIKTAKELDSLLLRLGFTEKEISSAWQEGKIEKLFHEGFEKKLGIYEEMRKLNKK